MRIFLNLQEQAPKMRRRVQIRTIVLRFSLTDHGNTSPLIPNGKNLFQPPNKAKLGCEFVNSSNALFWKRRNSLVDWSLNFSKRGAFPSVRLFWHEIGWNQHLYHLFRLSTIKNQFLVSSSADMYLKHTEITRSALFSLAYWFFQQFERVNAMNQMNKWGAMFVGLFVAWQNARSYAIGDLPASHSPPVSTGFPELYVSPKSRIQASIGAFNASIGLVFCLLAMSLQSGFRKDFFYCLIAVALYTMWAIFYRLTFCSVWVKQRYGR